MAWVVNVQIDPDKVNVGSATAVFTDTDGSTFTATTRATLSGANAQSFVTQAIAGRNTWQARKVSEAADRTAVINLFVAAAPPEPASSTQVNGGSLDIKLPG